MSEVEKLREKWLSAWEDGLDVGDMETILFKLGEAIGADREGAVEVEVDDVGQVRLFYPPGSKEEEMGYNGYVVPEEGRYLLIPLDD